MIEIAVKIFAFRLDFFKSKMEVFDAVIVVVSFVLDIVLRQCRRSRISRWTNYHTEVVESNSYS